MDEYPRLRNIEILPIVENGEKKLFFRDPEQITRDTLVLPYKNILIVKFLDGEHGLRDIQAGIMRETGELIYSEQIESFLDLMDKNFYLDNENFRLMKAKVEEEFKNQKTRESILAGNSFPADEKSLHDTIEGFFGLPDSAERINKEGKSEDLIGIISPHIDFDRGGVCYSHVLKELGEKSTAKKFLLLGTAHRSSDFYFALTLKDLETPFGVAQVDRDIASYLVENIGDEITSNEFKHKSEHSIEFQVVLLQYLLRDEPDFRIIPVLCGNLHETMLNNKEPIEIPEYRKVIECLEEIILPGDICIIAGADLSHIGPGFGDPEKVTGQMLGVVEGEDRKVLDTLQGADPGGFFSVIAEVRNRWRVCGFPPIMAQLYLLSDCAGKTIKYCQAKDPIQSVTFTAFSFYKN